VPKLTGTHQPPKLLTIEIAADDLYQIVYRLKHQSREHNVHPDRSREPREALEDILTSQGYDLSYREDLY
jgi:hypothetical protein